MKPFGDSESTFFRVGKAHLNAFAVVFASLWSATASAEQFVVVDETYEHTADMPDSHYRVDPPAGTPKDWRSPIDYASGTAHMHMEVFTKPTDTPTRFQACFEATPTYACIDQAPAYTTVGVYDWKTPFSNFWSPPGTSVDWTQGTNKIALILKDTNNGKPSADNVGETTAALYMPTKIRFVVTIVAPGSTYVPPGPADVPDSGAPMDAGGEAGGNGGNGGATGGAAGNGGSAGGGGTTSQPPKPIDNSSSCSVAGDRENVNGFPVALLLAAVASCVGRSRRYSLPSESKS